MDYDEKIDVFDASGINFSHHMSNQAVRRVRDQTGCTPVSKLIKKRRLCLFGHTARSYVELDHCSALCDETENPPQSYLVVVFATEFCDIGTGDLRFRFSADKGISFSSAFSLKNDKCIFRSASTLNYFRLHPTSMIFKRSTIQVLEEEEDFA